MAGSASTCSPERMSLTVSAPSEPGNHTKGMARLSANLICLPNFAALGATSVGMPRARNARATASERSRSSSLATATTTAVGTGRVARTRGAEIIRDTRRETPIDRPTPG